MTVDLPRASRNVVGLDNPTFVSPDSHYQEFDRAHPKEILTWATQTVDRLAVASSFQASGLVILHLLRNIRPDLPVLFLDTGFHFPETIAFRDELVEEWDLNLVILRGEHGSVAAQNELHGIGLYKKNPDMCCHINKVLPLQRALEDYDGWISGLRRDQSPMRAGTPIVEAQMLPSGREVFKIHPLAGWTRADVDGYISDNAIPTHPLFERGYSSIGCSPCTRPVDVAEHERAGRWDGFGKNECGIHSFGKPTGPRETEAEL
ncbi:MAG: phosphoadenylyl-sulfate reductase [Actinomycetota bacterium]|nr:phosphoadenylyl-sulfate reductase [Actinomycetota bacterium]